MSADLKHAPPSQPCPISRKPLFQGRRIFLVFFFFGRTRLEQYEGLWFHRTDDALFRIKQYKTFSSASFINSREFKSIVRSRNLIQFQRHSETWPLYDRYRYGGALSSRSIIVVRFRCETMKVAISKSLRWSVDGVSPEACNEGSIRPSNVQGWSELEWIRTTNLHPVHDEICLKG
jgi:hypothetical protein